MIYYKMRLSYKSITVGCQLTDVGALLLAFKNKEEKMFDKFKIPKDHILNLEKVIQTKKVVVLMVVNGKKKHQKSYLKVKK